MTTPDASAYTERVWRLLWPPVMVVWPVIGVILATKGDRLGTAIGVVFIATWLIYVVRVFRRRRT